MKLDRDFFRPNISRRAMFGAAAAMAATPAFAEECRIGPPPHPQGPSVWLNMDQVELDASYDQSVYAPLGRQVIARCVANSELVRKRLGPPQRVAYGPTEIEKLDIYRTKQPNAPIFLFIHGGAWLHGSAKDYAYAAETYVNAGAHYVVPDFIAVDKANGDLRGDGGAGSPRRGLDLQECEKLRRRREQALRRRPFLRRASVRRRARDRLAEGVRPAR